MRVMMAGRARVDRFRSSFLHPAQRLGVALRALGAASCKSEKLQSGSVLLHMAAMRGRGHNPAYADALCRCVAEGSTAGPPNESVTGKGPLWQMC